MSDLRIIVGAGAQGRVILETWRAQQPNARFVFLDDNAALHGTRILDAEVVGGVDQAASLGGEVILALGHNEKRLALAKKLAGARFGNAIHPSAIVMPSATIGAGTVVFPGAIVQTEARIGEHVIVNTGVIIEHDAKVGDGASISPGTKSGGRIVIGEGAFIATGVTLAPRVSIGAWSVIGAGSVVVSNIRDRTLAYGVPARAVGKIDETFDWQRLL